MPVVRRLLAAAALVAGMGAILTTGKGTAEPLDGGATPAPALDRELDRVLEQRERQQSEREQAAERERLAQQAARREKQAQEEARRRQTTRGYQQQIDAQLTVQADLLNEVRDELRSADPEPPQDVPGTRSAAQAPVDRELPPEIFETSRVEVRAGTWGNRKDLALVREVLDADGDGKPELVRWSEPDTGRRVRQQEDRNYDGIPDAWSDYSEGRVIARVLDSNDDGNPDVWERYHEGRMSSRELDRDDDGVRDAFYRYQGESLVEERHDANNDGRIDLLIVYERRQRVSSEEDLDRDGRIDTWTGYVTVGGAEQVARIERDRAGRGFADTYESYESREGRALLVRREEDLDGDGEIDVTSFYEHGKLRRRQISNPDAVLAGTPQVSEP